MLSVSSCTKALRDCVCGHIHPQEADLVVENGSPLLNYQNAENKFSRAENLAHKTAERSFFCRFVVYYSFSSKALNNIFA